MYFSPLTAFFGKVNGALPPACSGERRCAADLYPGASRAPQAPQASRASRASRGCQKNESSEQARATHPSKTCPPKKTTRASKSNQPKQVRARFQARARASKRTNHKHTPINFSVDIDAIDDIGDQHVAACNGTLATPNHCQQTQTIPSDGIGG